MARRVSSYNVRLRPFPTKVEGLDTVIANLNKAIKGVKVRTARGMVLAANMIRIETENIVPLTPVDTGNLRASWLVVTAEGLQPDPLGYSGKFKNKLFKKMQYKASEIKAQHSAIIGECLSTVSGNKDPMVIFGYSANYAAWVHEMLEKHPDVNWSREGSGGKWLEAAVKRNSKIIVQIIANESMIP